MVEEVVGRREVVSPSDWHNVVTKGGGGREVCWSGCDAPSRCCMSIDLIRFQTDDSNTSQSLIESENQRRKYWAQAGPL